jgi:zinc transport system substrate-binding protein
MISRIVLVIVAVLIASGCAGAAPANEVVASFYPLAYAAERIGGPSLHVDDLTPAGAEPHDLELTPRSVGRIQNARAVLYLGHNFQPAVSKAVEQGKGDRVDLLAGLPLRASTGSEEDLTADPHVWLDPVLFARIAERIGAVLHRPAVGLRRDLMRLDREYRNGLRSCTRREIVTSHAAFGYLAARYHLQQVPITGLTPESEPTPQELARAVKLVRRTRATTVFFETLVSPRLAETVAREVGARTAVLDPIEGLTAAEQEQGLNYLSLMRRNLETLRKALACR